MSKFLVVLWLVVLSGCANSSAERTDGAGQNEGKPKSALFDDGLGGRAYLRYECQHDSDCGVRDIGNCCGYYPACVHVESRPRPDLVARECEKSGMAGICGFPVIEACACVEGRCAAVPGPGEGALQ